MKTCSTCNLPKTPEEMVKDKRNKDGLSARCKLCEVEYQQRYYLKMQANHKVKNAEWYLKNKEKHNKKSSEWHRKNPRKSLSFHLRRYGMTLAQYEDMLQAQNGVCAICRKPEDTKRAKRLSVDHCHKTGRIRGLLCRNCNASIGLIKESIDTAKNLMQYLINDQRQEKTDV